MKPSNVISEITKTVHKALKNKPLKDQVQFLNDLRTAIHELSPFKDEPVDLVTWTAFDNVVANEYNPNKVAPPEMQLLEISITNDGYTQPIVTWKRDDNINEVVDGFHRNRVGKESKVVGKRIKGYLPTVAIREKQGGKNNRIASTIRHNRARGKHVVDAMSEIVIELKNRNWTNKRICRELGMDEDEVLRLCQISGLEAMFQDVDFSRAWNIEDSEPDDFDKLEGFVTDDEKQKNGWRTTNTSDPNRVFHTFDKWECYKAGFYNTTVDGMSKEECEQECARFLASEDEFRASLESVITDWPHSCEHYLLNESMNRIAWLGQAALCYAKGIPSTFRGGYHLLDQKDQERADKIALEYLNRWLKDNRKPEVSLFEAAKPERQVDIY